MEAVARMHRKPQAFSGSLEAAYREMALDETREAEAMQWVEGMIADVSSQAESDVQPDLADGQEEAKL